MFRYRYSSMYVLKLLILLSKLKVYHFHFINKRIKKTESSISFCTECNQKNAKIKILINVCPIPSLSLMVFSFLLRGLSLHTASPYKTRPTFSTSILIILTMQDLGQEGRPMRSIHWQLKEHLLSYQLSQSLRMLMLSFSIHSTCSASPFLQISPCTYFCFPSYVY